MNHYEINPFKSKHGEKVPMKLTEIIKFEEYVFRCANDSIDLVKALIVTFNNPFWVQMLAHRVSDGKPLSFAFLGDLFSATGSNRAIEGALGFGNGRFVAGSALLQMAYSDDGVTWRSAQRDHALGALGLRGMLSISHGRGRFVAGGLNGVFAYSNDGIRWTVVPNNPFGITSIGAIAFGSSIFVAGGDYGRVSTSTDGINWTETTEALSGAVRVIGFGNGRFVAVSGINNMSYW